MSDVPELILETGGNAIDTVQLQKYEEIKAESSLDYAKLNSDEQTAVSEFVKKIDITDSNMIMQYGFSAQNKVAQFSDSILENVRTKDMGDVGGTLTNLVVQVKSIDIDSKPGFFGGAKKKIQKMTTQYNSVDANISKIVDSLENHERKLLKDIQIFDEMYKKNVEYFKEISLYIIAGEVKLKEINETVLPQMKEKANATGEQVDIQALNDMNNYVNRFEKKVHDLKLSRMISIQMGPQIRMIQNNDAQLVEKIQSSIVNAIPLWKNQMVIAMGLANAQAALGAQRQVTDTTNELLKKNSEMLKQGTIDIAKESERGIIDIETVKKTNEDLISTISEVIRIQEEGSRKRAEAETELKNIEQDLKSKLLEARNLPSK